MIDAIYQLDAPKSTANFDLEICYSFYSHIQSDDILIKTNTSQFSFLYGESIRMNRRFIRWFSTARIESNIATTTSIRIAFTSQNWNEVHMRL